jgi:hypothetical protein
MGPPLNSCRECGAQEVSSEEAEDVLWERHVYACGSVLEGHSRRWSFTQSDACFDSVKEKR